MPQNHEDLPVAKASDFGPDLIREDQEDDLEDSPSKSLLETSEFLKLYNNHVKRMPYPMTVTRRTLQFYSSPQLRLMPLPIYKNGHKAHYVVPTHLNRLLNIQKLKVKFYFPLWLIREILQDFQEQQFIFYLESLDIAPGDLLDIIPLTKKLDIEDLMFYQSCKTLTRYSDRTGGGSRKQALDDPGLAFQREVEAALRGIKEWIDTKGREVYLRVQLAKHDKEVAALSEKFNGYKRKLMRQG